MNTMREYIEQELKVMVEDYQHNSKRIRQDYRRERELDQSYQGRELLELIQNADDELKDGLSKEVKISFDGENLSISNYGEPFSKEGVDSLMYSNLSSKAQRNMVIGNKGTGFRAILGWAEEITIHSGELHIRFSEKHAQETLESIVQDKTKMKNLRAATLVFPEIIDESADLEYTTEITIKVKKSQKVSEDIRRQIETITGDLLLFLNRTESLLIELDDSLVRYKKVKKNGNAIDIEKYEGDVLSQSDPWILKKRSGRFEDRNYSVVIAYRKDGALPDHQVIYSYFPTDVDFPFPVLLHGNFNLNADRNHLVKNDDANREILKTAANLLVEVAIDATKGKASYKPLKLLIEQKALNKELMDYGFRDILIEQISHCKILPTVNYKYISFDDEPVFYITELATVLDGENFDDLLQYTTDEGIVNLFKEIGTSEYNKDYMVELINKWAKGDECTEAIIKKHVVCMIGFVEEYGKMLVKTDDVPRLVFDSNGNRVGKGISVFLKEEESNVSTPPSFANIRFMHPTMRKIIEQRTGKKARQITEYLRYFNLKEYNTTQIIDKINSSIKTNISNRHIDRAGQYVDECLAWIWKNREVISGVGEKLKVYLRTRTGGLRLSDELYFGEEYQNDLCEKLFAWKSDDIFVDKIKGTIAADDSLLKDFLKTLNVAEFPRKTVKAITNRSKEYLDSLLARLPYPLFVGTDYITCKDDFFKNGSRVYLDFKATSIDDIDDILANVSTDIVLDWIYADRELYQILQSNRDMDGETELLWGRKMDYKPVAQQYVYPYLCWKFACTPWISINDVKYPVSSVILAPIGNKLAPDLVEPDLEEYVRDKNGANRLKDRYESVLQDIHVCAGFEELSDSQLYSVLLKLPEIEGTAEISKRVYTALLKDEREVDIDNASRKEFIEKGKVYCKDKHGYQKVSEVFYLDEKEVCQKVTSQFNLIDIPGHQSVIRIENLFGVKKLKLKGHLVGKPILHDLNSLFQSEFARFKVLAFCYRMDTATKDETRRFKDMKINLCTSVKAVYNEMAVDLMDYEFISTDNKNYYLRIPATIDERSKLHDVNVAASIAGILGSFFGSTKQFQQYRELYLSRKDSDRHELILQVFEDESIFERSAQAISAGLDQKDEFLEIVKKLTGCKQKLLDEYSEELDFDNIMLMSNMPIIVKLFRQVKIDIDDYNNEAMSAISLIPYYEDYITRLRRKYENLYKQTIFNKYLDKGIDEKKRLVRDFMDYDDKKLVIEDSVQYQCESEFIKQMGIDTSITVSDLNEVCNLNIERFKKMISSEQFLKEFLMDAGNLSLFYYGELDVLKREYELIVEENKIEEPDAQSRFREEIIPEVFSISTSPKKQDEKEMKPRKRTPGFTRRKNEKENVQIGRDGERFVYEMLKKRYKNVEWMSENGKEAGVNPTGSAGNGYDIRYEDDNGRTKYVEVKTSTSQDVIFYLSSFEHDFALKHIADYELFFVRNVSSKNKKPEILILQDLFVDDELNEEKYMIDIDRTYTISADIQQMKVMKKAQ